MRKSRGAWSPIRVREGHHEWKREKKREKKREALVSPFLWRTKCQNSLYTGNGHSFIPSFKISWLLYHIFCNTRPTILLSIHTYPLPSENQSSPFPRLWGYRNFTVPAHLGDHACILASSYPYPLLQLSYQPKRHSVLPNGCNRNGGSRVLKASDVY